EGVDRIANGSGPASEFGIELLDFVDGRICPLRDPAKVDWPGQADGFVQVRRFGLKLESVLKGILDDDDGREDHRDVVAGLARKQTRLVRELPEIGLTTKLHRVLKTAGSAVVRGERQMPVARD